MRRSGSWVILVSLMTSGSAWAQSPPPDLHLEGDHWTAWNPPEALTISEDAYKVQRGDTLWSLAERYLGDGNLWPQIWEQNRYILDAHWIYPDDPILLPEAAQQAFTQPEEVVGAPLDEAGQALAEGSMEDSDAAGEHEAYIDSQLATSQSEAPVPLGHEADIYCSGYIGELDEEFPYSISGSEYEFLVPSLDPRHESEIKGIWGKTDTQKYGLGLGDIVYVNGGRDDGLSAGELLTVIEPRQKIRHPGSHELIGRLYSYLGRIRVLSAQEDTAIGEIVLSCDPVFVGASLRVFEPEPVPLRRITPMRPVNYPESAAQLDDRPTIIYSRDNVISLGAGHLVYIDRGYEDDLAPGDIYTIYRQSRPGLPPIIMGEAGVLSVFQRTALARILRSRYTIYVGDTLLPK